MSLRMAAMETSVVQEITGTEDEAEYLRPQYSRPRSSARAHSSLSTSVQSSTLAFIIEKQLARAQELLAANHEQLLHVVEQALESKDTEIAELKEDLENRLCTLQPQKETQDTKQPFAASAKESKQLMTTIDTHSHKAGTMAWQDDIVVRAPTPQMRAPTPNDQATELHMFNESTSTSLGFDKDVASDNASTTEIMVHQDSATRTSNRNFFSDDEYYNTRMTLRSDQSRMSKQRERYYRASVAVQQAKVLMKKDAQENPSKGKDAPTPVFADAASMKEKVKAAVMKKEYDVRNFYKTRGCWQAIARNQLFDQITQLVIAVNAVWMSIDTDYNDADTLLQAKPIFQVAEHLFCCFFTMELSIRFAAFEYKRNCLRDSWFVFDACLVAVMITETWILNAVFLTQSGSGEGNVAFGDASILRLVRLLRLTRMARFAHLLRSMPEVMILVKGMSVATRSVFFTLCLLFIIIYVFALAFTQLTNGTDLQEEYFGTTPEAMYTLLLRGVVPDLADLVYSAGDEGPAFAILILIFVLLSYVTVMNMVIGVLVEVVRVVATVEKEQLTITFVKTKLLAMIEDTDIDQDGNKHISKKEFEKLILMPEGARILQEVGVDVVGLVDFIDHIFKEGQQISFPDFMELVLQLRGSNVCTVRDIVDLRKFTAKDLDTRFDTIVERIASDTAASLQDSVGALARDISNNLEKMNQQNGFYNGVTHGCTEV